VYSPTANAKLNDIGKKALERSIKVEFFTRSAVDFLLNLSDTLIGYVIKIGFPGDVFSDEFVGVLNGAFLPEGIRIGEVHDDLLSVFPGV